MTPAQIVQLLVDEEQKLIDYTFLASERCRKQLRLWRLSVIADAAGWCRALPGAAGRVDASVVDANLHWPTLHDTFGVDNERGLLQATMQPEEPVRNFAKRPGNPNLWVLPSGATLSNCNAVLSTDSIKNRIADLSRGFDYVLIDTPAMKTSPDCNLIGRLTGLSSYLPQIQPNGIRPSELEAANVTVLGAVLNRRTFPVPDGSTNTSGAGGHGTQEAQEAQASRRFQAFF